MVQIFILWIYGYGYAIGGEGGGELLFTNFVLLPLHMFSQLRVYVSMGIICLPNLTLH